MKKAFFTVICIMVFSFICSIAIAGSGDLRGAHKDRGIACEDCHGTKTPEKKAPASVCKTCHADHRGEIKTYKNNGHEVKVNPHDSHQGELRCTLCHSIHEPSKLYCNQDGCHAFENNMNVK
ncbi:cytochrome c3 family protein [Seleniivibrio sp.]|uniref:cytochrome c3 family protein n=1 Tax=Seleniivibrio sp. TaxID=2898801 RepID=UPI0025F4BF75|nr:cytochrome c3 family protein [Seleniivibrio sp.]MCD8553671.1 cytochrome c3 family protein [Seleniivibrio sp.]